MKAEPLSDADRARLYDWFARLLADAPDAEALHALRTTEGAALVAGLRAVPELAPLAEALDAVARTHPETAARDLAAAFARLFHGAGGRQSLPACESVHREGRLHGAAAAEMEALLRDLGLSPEAGFREPPDHVAVQLATMAELVRRRDARQLWLLCERLGWIDMLEARVRQLDRHGFYTAALAALRAFLRADRERLDAEAPPREAEEEISRPR